MVEIGQQTNGVESAVSVRRGVKKRGKWRKGLDFAAVLGWVVSLFVHLLIIILIANIDWLGKGEGGGREREVGIVDGGGGGSIMYGQDEGIEVAGAEVKLETFVNETEVTEEFEDVGVTPMEVSLSVSSGDNAAGLVSAGGGSIGWGEAGVSGGGSGSGGASFFGLEVKGGKFVYVVDKSGSMKGRPLDSAKTELLRSISSLGEKQEFYVIFYDTGFQAMPGAGLVKGSDKNKRDCFSWVKGVGSTGGTNPTEAMKRALELRPDAIWLLSDGEFNSGIAETIQQANSDGRVVISTIAFLSRDGEAVLRTIADQNGGKYRFVSGLRSR